MSEDNQSISGLRKNWLIKFTKTKIQRSPRKKDLDEKLWHKCQSCEHMIFYKEFANNLYVCPRCEYHERLRIKNRLSLLFDYGDYYCIELPKVPYDPLKFKDLKKYSQRLKENKSKTKDQEAAVVAYGNIDKNNTIVVAFNFDFMGGSMGIAVGEAFVTAAELALKQRSPLVLVSASGGARMQEGTLALMQMARTVVMINKLKEARLPYIVILTNPTTGGVSASLAMLGDVHIAEQGALIAFTGARVIETTIRQKLPEGFQTAEYLLEHGMIDIVVHRSQLHQTVGSVLSMLLYNQKIHMHHAH